MSRQMRVGEIKISDSAPAFVIAEIGHNHAGEMEKAKAMVQTAKASGASAVKFQTRHPLEVYTRGTKPGAYDYVSSNPQWMDKVYGKHREKLEFSPSQWKELFDFCHSEGVIALSTPFDFKSVDLLESLGVPAFKVASGDATNIPMIEYIAQTRKPMFISTGGCSIEDVDRIHEAMGRTGTQFALLQCSCIYPAPPHVLNLRVIETYRQRYPDNVIGLSTHNPNFYATIAAYTLGGRVFEHHYTNDRSWRGTDNHFSLDPGMLKKLVEGLEEVRQAIGDGQKHRFPEEHTYTLERRKKLVWSRELPAGHVITANDIEIKCPGDGVKPFELPKVLNLKLKKAVVAEGDVLPEQVGVPLEMERAS